MVKRSAEEVERLLRAFDESGLSRREYCRQAGVSVSTLDYYRARRSSKRQAKRGSAVDLVRVRLTPATQPVGTFQIQLTKGRRIESAWNFVDGDLSRLIRVVEGA